ncbi:beta-ketoacyl synthase N-terminal-like domain-containing protein [Micromonospora sp. WMMD882]|uniref:type I polyketide synthase n=1 Tax=Micromonospora sp. WMMD882 TaxID=3015151 RepID=UPI00248CF10C|nr:type I polyketide synthase [Micromonospora sp. WMMD882]WBB80650.1 beta-ketoacyl synthase N-terminal-like domain-containing protein [Micromonospora sp. WMMD882]
MSDRAVRTDDLTPLQRALLGIRELRAQLAEVERAKTEPIAVIGMGCRLPGGANDPESFWKLLHDGADVIREMPADRWDTDAYFDPDPETPGKMSTRWGGFLDDIDGFDPGFFGISPWEAANMDPQQRLMLEVAQEAFDDAGQARDQLRGSRTGVFVGLAHSEYGWLNFNNPDLANVYTATGSFGSIVANRVSYVYDLRGPSYTLDAVCSSSLLAVHQACESLRSGDCTMALAGGAGLFLKPEGFVWFTKLGVMSPDGRCKAFDARGDGIVLGEGVAAVVLKTLSRALADGDPIHAVLRGSAVAQDGRSNGLTAPSRLSQEAMLREAYERAGVDPAAVQYVEAHGTGTILGDPIEAQALGTILGARRDADRPLMIGSVKTNIGHLQMVGGLAGLLKVILAMRHRQVPASLHYTEGNPHIPFDDYRLRVQDRRGPWPYEGPLLAGVTSLSFGGTNVHMVVEEAPAAVASPAAGPAGEGVAERARLLPLSAHDRAALRDLAAGLGEHVADPGVDLDDLCYTTALRRTHHDDRLTVSFTSRADLTDKLAAFAAGTVRPGLSTGDRTGHVRRRTVFVFPGQGGQWVGMGRRLLDTEPVFRQAIEECAAAMAPYVSWSLVDELRADGSTSRLDQIDVVQPTTWAVQVALAALWRSWGIVPDAVVGHSMGEVAAAHVAGALDLADAARVICRRSALVRRIRGRGTMAVVELPLAEARAAIAGLEDQLAIAVSNSPTSTVLSGDTTAIETVLKTLTERDVFCRQVRVDFASHSPQVDELRDDLLAELRTVTPRAATVPFHSTVTGRPTDGRELTAAYWADNLREPVLFATVLGDLVTSAPTQVVEISPHPILLPSVEQCARHAGVAVAALPSLRRDEDERAVLLGTLGALWTLGHRVDWRRQHPTDRTALRLPRYPWQRQRCWLEFDPAGTTSTGSAGVSGAASAGAAASGAAVERGGRYLRAAAPGGEHFWELVVDPAARPDLAGLADVPESVHLDLALAAAVPVTGVPTCALTDVTFEAGLATQGRVTQVVVDGGRDGVAGWQVLSRPADSGRAPGPWIRHARGTLRAVTGGGQPYLLPQETPDAVRERCATDVPGEVYRAGRAAVGRPDHAGARAVRRLWRRDGEALALLAVPDGWSPLDWRLLAGVFDLLPVVAPDPVASAVGHRPVAVERLRAYRPATGELWAHVRLREVGADALTGDLRLLDADLRVVAEVTGLRATLGGRPDDLPSAGTAGPTATAAPGATVLPTATADASGPTVLPAATAATAVRDDGAAAADGPAGDGPGGGGGAAGPTAAPTSRAVLSTIAPDRRRAALAGYLGEQIAAVLGLLPQQLDPTQPLLGLGLNSLMVFELRNRLRVMYGTQIAAQEFLSGITVDRIVDTVLTQLDAPGTPAPPAPPGTAAAARSGTVPGPAAVPQSASRPTPRRSVGPARPATAEVSVDPADWLVRGVPDASARLRLFCLPYAGGNAALYRAWDDALPAGVQVCPIQLPGRDQRHREPAFTRMSELTRTLTDVLRPYLDQPYALFGHSMGALVAYETTRWLRRRGLPAPAHLYVSAARAPHLPDPEPPMHRLPEAKLVDRLRAMGGTPEEMLADPETLAVYLPLLRADFAMVETRIHQTEPPLDVPLTVFGGDRDDKITTDQLAAWREQTVAAFDLTVLPGDHFFVQRERAALLAALAARLTDDLTRLDDPADPRVS